MASPHAGLVRHWVHDVNLIRHPHSLAVNFSDLLHKLTLTSDVNFTSKKVKSRWKILQSNSLCPDTFHWHLFFGIYQERDIHFQDATWDIWNMSGGCTNNNMNLILLNINFFPLKKIHLDISGTLWLFAVHTQESRSCIAQVWYFFFFFICDLISDWLCAGHTGGPEGSDVAYGL